MKSQQSGFAHAFLIIGLVVALIGALGFVFWQNFIYEEPVVTKTEVVTESPKKEEKTVTPAIRQPEIVNEDEYSLTVVKGFDESSTQMFTYTGSFEAVKTFVNEEGDYFEVLVPKGGGGGMSADYFWSYAVNGANLSLKKSDRCNDGSFACTAGNGSVEGIISSQDRAQKYTFDFGNKTKNETNLSFVDEFISSLQLK